MTFTSKSFFWAALVSTLPVGAISQPADAQVVRMRPATAETSQVTPPPGTVPAKTDARTDVLSRRVTLQFDDVSLQAALQAVATQGKFDIAYHKRVLTETRRVTIPKRSMTVREAFALILKDTDLEAVVLPSGQVSIRPANSDRQSGAPVVGHVRDVAGNPLPEARVTLRGTAMITETATNGHFRFNTVPPGSYVVVVSKFGFSPAMDSITVSGTDSVFVTLTLPRISTRLTEVVTTATGNEQRLKVGNDVGTINADSLVQNTLVRSLSDLLTGHTPGVQATPTSGAVGAPTKIRVRGVTSTQLNNDPIVVIDGVRVNAQTTRNSVQYFGAYLPSSQVNTGNTSFGPDRDGFNQTLAPSPIDQIDPNMIESIDVLRGPTATALYGPDASAGVIVVKTKTGKPGPWRYHVSGDKGWILPLRTYPLQYTGWGTSGSGTSQPECVLIAQYTGEPNQADHSCELDSVTAFNPQNDPQMTTLGTGNSRSIEADASGGGSTVQGFLQGDYSDALGQQELSKVEQRRLARTWTTPVPSWMIRPNGQNNTHVLTKVDAQFTPQFSVSATGQGTYQLTRNDGNGLGTSSNVYGPGDTLAYLPAENLRSRVTSSTQRGLGSTNATFQPLRWLVLTGTGGLDYSQRDDQSLVRSQDCLSAVSYCTSSHSDTRTQVLVPSFNVGATITYDLTSWLNAHTAFGEQYSRTQSYIVGISASGLGLGSDVVTGATTINDPTEAHDEQASAGWYLEQQLGFSQRLFLTAALRRDASSAFGQNIATPTFPKYGLSWLVSNEPFFPHQSLVTQFRLRSAYGESGKQGSQSDVLRNFLFTNGLSNSTGETVPVLVLAGIGNSHLQPQRDKEWEGGFDLSFYNDRATITTTWYRKQSHNAIISVNLPPSPGAEEAIQSVNVGDIQNVGTEVQLSLRPIDTRAVTWDFGLSASSNNNKLVNANGQLTFPPNTGGQIVPGYPLFGLWERPIVAYGDYNHDNILETNEIVFGDSDVFIGSTDPKGSFNYSNSLTFLSGRFRVNSLISQVKGLTGSYSYYGARALVDSTASLAEQAAALQAFGTPTYRGGAGGYLGVVSYVNFAELSASYTLPEAFARRFHSRSATFTLAGRNLKLWTNYRGADPTTNTSNAGGDGSNDSGTGLAQPRQWVMRFNFQF